MGKVTIVVDCPVCETPLEAYCSVDPGERMVTSGPSDSWYPGSPPMVDAVESAEYDCACRANLAKMFAFEEVTQKQVLEVYDASIDELVRKEDLPKWED